MGTNYIAPTWRMPKNFNKDKLSNYSITYDGGNDYITIDDNIFSGLETWSMAGFYNLSTLSVDNAIFGKYGNSPQQILLYWDNPLGWRLLWNGVSASGQLVQLPTIQANEWYFIAVTYDGATVKMYLDDQVYTSSATTGAIISDALPWQIGADGNSNKDFNGKLSQISFYDYALSPTQVGYLRDLNNPMAIDGAEPIAYYPMGDNSNPTSTAGYPNISVGADSVFDFNGSNDFIDLDPSIVKYFDNDNFSLSVWVKSDVFSGYNYIFQDGATSNNRVMQLLNYTGRSGLEFTYGNGTSYRTSPNIALNDGQWYHVVVTYSSVDGAKIYIDGNTTPAATNTGTIALDRSSHSKAGIGAYVVSGTSNYWNGNISNMQIWNAVLGTSDVTTLYNNGQPLMTGTQPEEANLRAWYKLNQSANWEADAVGEWQIPNALSAYPQSFSFNGVDNQINLGLESNFSLGGASKYSTSLWFKKYSNGTNCFWGYNYGDPNGSGFYIWQSSGAFRVAVGNNSLTSSFGYYNITAANVPIGEWINVVVVFDGTLASGDDRIKVYQNGEIATGTYVNGSNFPATLPNGNGASNRNIYLGQLQLANGSFAYSFDGKMSNVMQWTTDLSLSDATAIYNNGVPLPTASVQASDLKGWWKLDNNGRFQGNWRNIDYAENLNYTKALSRIGPDNGVTSAGNGDRVNCGNDSSLQITGAMSISMWFRVNTISPLHSYNFVMGRSRYRTEAAADAVWTLLLKGVSYGNPAHFQLQLSDGTTKTNYDITETTNGDFFNDRWQNLIITYDGTTDANSIKAYLNGELHQQFTSSQASINNIAARNLTFYDNDVYQYGDPTYTGALSNCAIWNKKLELSDISSIWNNGSPALTMPSESALQGWWKFSDGTYDAGNTSWSFPDSSQNSNTGETYTFTSSATAFDANSMSDNNVQAGTGISSGMTEQNLVNNNVSALNGESSGMDTTNLVQSNLTKKQPFSSYSIEWDAGTDYMDMPASTWTGGEEYTVSLWNRKDSFGNVLSGVPFVWAQGTSNDYRNLVMWWANSTTLVFSNGQEQNSTKQFTGTFADEWYHLCFVATLPSAPTPSGTDLKIYLNGVEQTLAGPASWLSAGQSTSALGRLPNNAGFNYNGKMSNVAIFESKLNQDDVLNLYNNGVTQDLNNFRIVPKHWWPLDGEYTYFNGTSLVGRDIISNVDAVGNNLVQADIIGDAPGSESNGTGTNLDLSDLIGDMKDSKLNAYSINMADYADGVTNPANSGRSTETP